MATCANAEAQVATTLPCPKYLRHIGVFVVL